VTVRVAVLVEHDPSRLVVLELVEQYGSVDVCLHCFTHATPNTLLHVPSE
jgi:hypothetical protein